MNRGHIKIFRKIIDSPIGQDSKLLSVAIYLILKANWKDKETNFERKCMYIKRGQAIIGTVDLATKLRLSRATTRSTIKKLSDLGFLTTEPTNKFTIVTICNYDSYQDEESQTNQQTNQQKIDQQPKSNQQITTSILKKEYLSENTKGNVLEVSSTQSTEGGDLGLDDGDL